MSDTTFITEAGARKKAANIKTALALSKVRFFKASLVPNESTTVAQLEAAECDYDGYTPGGITLTAWTGPLDDPAGGAVITSPLVSLAYGPAADPPVTNSVGGYWIEDADGDDRIVGIYDPPRAMAAIGDGWVFVQQDVEGRNA